MNENNASASALSKEDARSLASLGKALREARENKNLSLDDLAAATCIRKNFLEDIEAGRFENFKALVYARGFVRTCTEVLEVPELWNEYSAQLTHDAFETISSAHKPAAYSAESGPRVSTLPPTSMRSGASVAAPTRGFRHSSTRRNCIIALLLLVIAAVAALAFNWDRIRSEISRIQAEQAETAVKKREAEQALLAEKKKAEEEAVALERQKRAQAAQPIVAEKAPAPVVEKPVEPPAPAKPALTIRAAGKCWLRVRSGRRTVLETTISEGWERTFDLDAPLDVVFGFGQNVSVSTNGTDFASPGKGRQRYEYQPDGTSTRLRK